MSTAAASDLAFLGASEIAQKVRARALSPVETVAHAVAVVEKANPTLNAICTLDAEGALAAARSLEAAIMAGEAVGPLAGVPVGIKDVTETAGIRTTHGSPVYADNVPAEDAFLVARLKQAGAIVIGKTNTPPFAVGGITDNPLFGSTRNPWDPGLIAGGSTGGGAAALASGMIALADGTDFGGSLRQPASFCGVVGLRPSPGLVPRRPTPLPWQTLDVSGGMARDAGDLALMLDVISGPDPRAPISVAPPVPSFHDAVAAFRCAGRRIAYAGDICGVPIDPEIESVCRAAALRLSNAGAAVDEIALDLSEGRDAFLTLRGQFKVSEHFENLDRIGDLGENLAANIRAGLTLTPLEIAGAEAARKRVFERLIGIFDTYDALFTPCVAVPPFAVGRSYPEKIAGEPMRSYIDWMAPTFVISLCSVPAASAPAGLTASGLPVGVQIVGSRLGEATVLGIAKAVHEASGVGRPSRFSA